MSIFKKIGSFFKKAFTNPQTVGNEIQVAQSTLAVIGPLATSIVAFTAGADGANEAASVVAEIQRDLGTVHGLLATYDAAHPGTVNDAIKATLSDVTVNLKNLVAAGHIKNPDTQAKVATIVNTIAGETQAIMSALPATA